MDIEKYKLLTGKTFDPTSNEQQIYSARLTRAIAELENKLGWKFAMNPFVFETGKTKSPVCRFDGNVADLDPADAPVGQLRVFPINWKDKHFSVDPFYNIHAVKLVVSTRDGGHFTAKQGDYVTIREIQNYEPFFGKHEIAKYITRCSSCTNPCGCKDCVFLMVDANWLDESSIPIDLQYLIVDYVDYLTELAGSSGLIKSESVDGHSISYVTNISTRNPYLNSSGRAIIEKYAGPFGEITKFNIK